MRRIIPIGYTRSDGDDHMASLPKTPLPKTPAKSKSFSTAGSVVPLAAERSVAASKAKAQLLELLDTVDRKRETILITKRGRPVARLVPLEPRRPADIFGCMKGTFRIIGDVVGPEPDLRGAML